MCAHSMLHFRTHATPTLTNANGTPQEMRPCMVMWSVARVMKRKHVGKMPVRNEYKSTKQPSEAPCDKTKWCCVKHPWRNWTNQRSCTSVIQRRHTMWRNTVRQRTHAILPFGFEDKCNTKCTIRPQKGDKILFNLKVPRTSSCCRIFMCNINCSPQQHDANEPRHNLL